MYTVCDLVNCDWNIGTLTQCLQDDISRYFLESKAAVTGHIIKGLAASGSSCPRHAGHNIPMELAATLAKTKRYHGGKKQNEKWVPASHI